MKIAIYSMMKNEKTLAVAFSEMLKEFADYAYILDHSSTDGTAETIKSIYPDARIFNLVSRRYPQSEMSNFFARKIFGETDADYLFLLDADEFLPFSTKTEMIEFLQSAHECNVIAFPWNNLAPAGNSFDDGFYTMGCSLNYAKVALSRSLTAFHDYTIGQGNHVVTSKRGNVITEFSASKCLLHLPIPSHAKFQLKILQGINSMKNDRVNTALGNGFHWVQLADRICSGRLSREDIRQLAYYYSGSTPNLQHETFELFQFPYIKTRDIPEVDVSEILRYCLDDATKKHQNKEIDRHIDFVVTNTNGEVFLKRIKSSVNDAASIASQKIKSIIPNNAKNILKKIYRYCNGDYHDRN